MSAFQQPEQNSDVTPCVNPGNPVFSCTTTVPVTKASAVPWARAQNPLYRTTSSEYGIRPPTAECAPCSHHPLSQSFTEHLGSCGMYRDNSLNTAVDRSRVHDCVNLQNTL